MIQATRTELYDALVDSGAFNSLNLAHAFRDIDRADFVLPQYRELAYVDTALPIGEGQTISQPSTVAFMLNLLDAQPGEKVLDIGAGSGYTTALLAYLVGEAGSVIGLERIAPLLEFGRANITKYHFPQAKILPVERDQPCYPEGIPYNRILVSAASKQLPETLVDQLTIGGRMVIPIGQSIWQIDRLNETEVAQREIPGFLFVPLR